MLRSGKRTGRRAALVIGNSAYQVRPLANPKNDALSISRILRELGFEVQLGLDLDHAGMEAIFSEFESRHSDVALLYFSGHGLQVGGVNYLVPVGSQSAAASFPDKFVAVEQWIERMARCSDTRLVFFDACRKNPSASRLIETAARSTGGYPIVVGTGLAEVKAKPETFIAFAAAPGRVAYDGTGKHSPFTEGLLRNIETTDLPISNLMIRVRNDVLADTEGRQETWDQSALRSPFFFNPGSLILLIGNAIGLVAFLASLLPHQFALAIERLPNKDRHWWAMVLVGIFIWLVTLALFLIGLQRAYRILRGERELKGAAGGRTQTDFALVWRKGVFGGFFGGIIATPIITLGYYVSWSLWGLDPDKAYPKLFVERRPAFGEMLTEFTIASVVAGVVLGVLSLVVAEYFARSGRRFSPRSHARNRLWGATAGGLFSAIIVMPPLVLYFEPKPWIVPHAAAVFPGALLGVAIMVFSIVNYSLEQFSVRKLIRTGLSVLRSMLIVSAIAAIPLLVIIITPHQDFLLEFLERIHIITIGTEAISIPHGWPIMVVGVTAGIVFGPLLGAVIGLTLMRDDETGRASF